MLCWERESIHESRKALDKLNRESNGCSVSAFGFTFTLKSGETSSSVAVTLSGPGSDNSSSISV